MYVHRRALASVLLVLAVVVSAMAPVRVASAETKEQRKQRINQEIRTLREQVEEASEAETELLGRLDDVQDKRRQLDARVAGLDAQIRANEADVTAAQGNLDRLQGEFVRAQTKLADAQGQVAEARSELRDRAVAAYVGQPAVHAADLMLRAKTMREVAATAGYLEAMVSSQKAALDRYSKLRDETVALRAAAEATKDEAMAQRNVVLSRVSALEASRQEQDFVRQEVLGHEREQGALVEQVRSRKAEFQAQINALRAESNAISGLLQGAQGGQAVQPSGKGVLAMPIPGARITSVFGPRMHPIYQEMRTHDGIDFAAGTGTPIRASADGVVVYAGPRGGYGNATVIDHGNSLATLYAHQSAIHVSVGQQVLRNQAIGAVGSTGFSTGPHLHYEVRVQGVPVDPMRYL